METPNVFLITGTSTGFGRELVLLLNAQRHKVIATARNLEKIKDFEQLEQVAILKLDISSPQEEVARFVQEAIEIHGCVTHLINNAAYGVYGCVEEVSLDQTREQFETNYWGTIRVTDAILLHFRTRKEGEKFITTISSLTGISNFPYISFYCASKFAIEATFEALKSETQHLGIKVLLIEPGYFRTNFLQADTNIQKPANSIADYAPISSALGKVILEKNGTQNGDPKVGSQRIIELLTNTGFAKEIADGNVPIRIALGSDAYQGLINKANNLIENANKWKVFSCSTDFKTNRVFCRSCIKLYCI